MVINAFLAAEDKNSTSTAASIFPAWREPL